MDTKQPGPLSRLLKGLGIDAELAPIAAVSRITEMPVQLNPETLLGNKPLGEIDLRRRYGIVTQLHGSHRGVQHWTAIDQNSYDGPDPDGGVGSCVGSGPTEGDAKLDLLDKIADAEKKSRPRASRVIYHSGNREEPNEYADKREPDFDDDLEDR